MQPLPLLALALTPLLTPMLSLSLITHHMRDVAISCTLAMYKHPLSYNKPWHSWYSR